MKVQGYIFLNNPYLSDFDYKKILINNMSFASKSYRKGKKNSRRQTREDSL